MEDAEKYGILGKFIQIVGIALTSPTATLMICGTSFPGPVKMDPPGKKMNSPQNQEKIKT